MGTEAATNTSGLHLGKKIKFLSLSGVVFVFVFFFNQMDVWASEPL